MPFTSKAQSRFLRAKYPEMAERWAKETPDIKKLPEHVADKKSAYKRLMNHKTSK